MRNLVTFLALSVGLWTLFATPLIAQQSPRDRRSPGSELELKARAAKGGDDLAIRELAAEVFNPFVDPSDEGVASVLKPFVDRLYRAEKLFRDTGRVGVSVSNVTQAVNGVASRLDAPEYAFTTDEQVKSLVTVSQRTLPTFMAGIQDKSSGVQPSVYNLSPIQAGYITVLMLKQKLENPEFQTTAQDWDDQRQGRAAALAGGTESRRKALREQMIVDFRRNLAQNPNREQLIRLLADFASKHSPGELIALGDRAMDDLHLQR
jgi:hypothetical protein